MACDPHIPSEQFQVEDGWKVVCGCSAEFFGTTRDQALEGHTGHWNVVQARRALKRADETKETGA